MSVFFFFYLSIDIFNRNDVDSGKSDVNINRVTSIFVSFTKDRGFPFSEGYASPPPLSFFFLFERLALKYHNLIESNDTLMKKKSMDRLFFFAFYIYIYFAPTRWNSASSFHVEAKENGRRRGCGDTVAAGLRTVLTPSSQCGLVLAAAGELRMGPGHAAVMSGPHPWARVPFFIS